MAQPAFGSQILSATGCDISKKAYLQKALLTYAKDKKITPRLSGGGATRGIRLAANKQIDIGATCRQRLTDIGGNIYEKERDVRLVHIGWDAIVIIAHPNIQLQSISKEAVKAVFSGEINNWTQLGAKDSLELKPMARKGKLSGVGYTARLLIFNDPKYEFKHLAREFKSTGPLEKSVATIPGAIALDGVSSARKVKVGLGGLTDHQGVKILGIDGFLPTKEHIAKANYPFFRPLFVAINKHNKNPTVLGFIDFLLGPKGQKIISDEGTVNLEEGKLLNMLWEAKMAKLGRFWQEKLGPYPRKKP